MTAPYLNRQLFSDHWLRERLPLRDDFALTPLGLAKLALWTRELAAMTVAATTWSAQETLEQVVVPCLRLLGYQTGVGAWMSAQLTLWPEHGHMFWQRVPLALPAIGAPPSTLIAVVPWGVELDARGSSLNGAATNATNATNAERSAQAMAPALLFLRQLASSEAEWGILTNGRRWRLYYRGGDLLEASYEVALSTLAAEDDASDRDDLGAVDALKYFWLFFAASAQRSPEDGEPAFLRVALRESREYAARIEDDLRGRAFDAIQAACQALADALAAERGMTAALLARDDLAEVYNDALALLYRLLFVLFAESRALLPIHDERYARDYSLRALIAALPATLDGDRDPARSGTREPIWPRLARLFQTLNGGDPASGVPDFSGRLFDDALHPLLARLALADGPLARMLILLGRTQQGQQIDYADLAVRQLGSIYEGLLEHQAIAVAVEEMALARGPKDKAALIVRSADAGERRMLTRYPPGTVYLSNDRGERHAAGTYYTPEPVVRYLVEETLGPLVAGKTPDEILHLRVLDPAMGSAHFLVAAVDYLTRAVLAAQERLAATQPADGALATGKGGKSASARPRAQRPDGDESAPETDVMELKRRIAEQCVYGVDVNEAAVELGKLSLWLATAAKDRPLAFLDLHLRAGNSLMGLAPGELQAALEQPAAAKTRRRAARKPSATPTLDTPDAAPAQPSLWNETAFTQVMFRVVGAAHVIDMMPTDTAEAVRTKLYVAQQLQREINPWRAAADLAVSLRLGAAIPPEQYRAALGTLLDHGVFRLADATLSDALEVARAARERHGLFHWDLEFQDAFYDGNGQPLGAAAGFDAILGNPPYVSVTTLRASDPVAWVYYPRVFATTARGQYDLYVAFVERALALLNARGRLAYILPNKWLTTDFGGPLRALLAGRRAVRALVDFGAYQVFPGVSNYTCLLFAGRAPTDAVAVTRRAEPEGELDLPPTPHDPAWATGTVAAGSLNGDPWNLTVGAAAAIMARWDGWPTLSDIVTIFSGTGTRADSVFILTEVARDGEIVTCHAPALGRTVALEAALLHPVLQGRDIQPYRYDDHQARLLSPYRLADGRATLLPADELRSRYPLAWAYLNDPAIRAILEARENGRFRTRDDWYGFGYPRNMTLLPEPKLVLPDVAARGRVAWDGAGHDIVDTAYGIALRPESPYAPGFVLAALNHPVLTFFLRHRGTDLRGGYFRMKTAYLNPFPLPPIAGDLPAGERRARADGAVERARAAIQAGIQAGQPADEIAARLAELGSQPAGVVHDVVAVLALYVGDLAERERLAWDAFAARVAALRPGVITRNDDALRFDEGQPLEAPDALIAAFARHNAPLSAPEMSAIRAAHGETRAIVSASRREREATLAVVDELLYQLYGLPAEERAIITGSAPTVQRADDTLSYGSQRRRNNRTQRTQRNQRDDAGERALAQEEPGTMRQITKGSHPANIARCVAQALANPYSDSATMNAAMGYVATSQTGPHYVNMAIVTGLLAETPQGWFRPTESGRALLAGGAGAANDAVNEAGVWDALLSLPAYRHYLEYKALTLAQRHHTRAPAIARQIEDATREAFPGFHARAVSLQQMLGFDDLTAEQAVGALRKPPMLEPIATESLLAWSLAQGVGREGRSHLSRAAEIGGLLARAQRISLTVLSEWLTDPAWLLALLLLIAARQQGQGVVVARDAGRNGNGATPLSQATDALRLRGLDIRYERRGETLIATLVPAITLCIVAQSDLDALEAMRGVEMAALARVVVAAARADLREGVDGETRGAIAPADLAARCVEARFDGPGEFASAHAADDAPPVESRVVVGPLPPLASDPPLLGRDYRFFADATQAMARRRPGAVAALLSEWLTAQRREPQQAVNVNPHLALLYLIAADLDHRAEMLSRRDGDWYFAGTPLVQALDDRLRGLGFAVWDEAYADDEPRQHALGAALVEQGLSLGVLEASENSAALLEAPASYGYYGAVELLEAQPLSRRRE